MGETIINSNQVRASGDTSSQTLLNENQIRQAGDTSSETLLNKNQIAQSQGTLNAEIVGTPTISDDFILSDFDNNNYLKFNPATPTNAKCKFTCKFRVTDLTKKGCIFMCTPDQKGFKFTYGEDGVGQYGFSCLFTDSNGTQWANSNGTSRYYISNVYTTANQWVWVTIEILTNTNFLVSLSTDGENYTQIKDGWTWYNTPPNFSNLTYEQIGTGDSGNGIEIDLKEVKYYIDDVLSWEAVSF